MKFGAEKYRNFHSGNLRPFSEAPSPLAYRFRLLFGLFSDELESIILSLTKT